MPPLSTRSGLTFILVPISWGFKYFYHGPTLLKLPFNYIQSTDMRRHENIEPQTGESAVYWQAPDLGQVDLLKARYITHNFTRHTHEAFAIGIIEQGAEAFYYRRRNYIAPAGSIVVINPGEVHTGQAGDEAGWAYRMLYPEASLLLNASAVTGWGSLPDFPEPVIWDPSLADTIRRLHAILETSEFPLERESALLHALTTLVIRHASRGGPGSADRLAGYPARPPGMRAACPAIERVREYIESNFSVNIALSDLAEIGGLSAYHLLRMFKETTGLPPHAYQNQRRVAYGRKLIELGWPIAFAAAEAGFTDQSHFSRRFKGIYGITPGQFLRGRSGIAPVAQ